MANKKIVAPAVEETKVEQPVDIVEEMQFDPNEPIFEGGPNQSKIEEWKSLYGHIYLTEFEENEIFIWRTLTRKEFKEIMKADGADSLYREERVCEKCVIFPQNYNFMAMTTGKAGIPTLLSEQIMDRSGFSAKTGPIML